MLRHALLSLWLASVAIGLTPSVRGETLPAGVVARLGSTRFRAGEANACLAISPDGKLLASGGGGCVRFWDRASGKQIRAVDVPVFAVFKVAFSPDGKYFAALGDHMPLISRPFGDVVDNSVFVGEVGSGKILHQFRGRHTSFVFSPDSARLLAGGTVFNSRDQEYPVVAWDIPGGKLQHQYPVVLCYALSPDGKLLAGGDKKGVIYLWDARTGVEQRKLQGHGSPIRVLAFAPDGRTLVSASGDNGSFELQRGGEKAAKPDRSVRLWDVASGKERVPPRSHANRIDRLQFAPDGKTFVALDERGTLLLCDADTARLRQRFPRDSRDGNVFFYSPDGKYLLYRGPFLAMDRNEELHQWDIAAGKELRRWEAPERGCSEYLFSRDGKSLFSLGASIREWDFLTLKERHPEPGHRAALRTLLFSPDAKHLATVDERHGLRLWDTASRKPLPAFDTTRILRCAFTPDGGKLITIAEDTTVSVREVPSGRELRRFRLGPLLTAAQWSANIDRHALRNLELFDHPNSCCVFDRERRLLAVADADECIHLWDVLRGQELRRLEGHRGNITEMYFTPDAQRLLSYGADGALRWWDVASGEQRRCFQDAATDTLRFSLSEDGKFLAWASREKIHLWDFAADREVRSFPGHRRGTTQVLLERGGGVLVSAGGDHAVRCWDTRTGQELRAITREADAGENASLLRAPDGRVLIDLSMDRKNSRYTLLEAVTGRPVCARPSYNGQDVALAPDGKTLVVTGDKLVFHERASGGIVAEVPADHRGRITCVVFSPDGRFLATGGEDTTVLLWDWRRLTGLARDDTTPPGDEELATAWSDLTAPSACKAYRAIGVLTAGGEQAVALLRRRLHPISAAERDAWKKRLADLNADDFAVREKASQELAQLGVEAYFFLRRAAANDLPLEARRRLLQVLSSEAMRRPSGDSLRAIRAVQVLDGIATPAAQRLLTEWSRGDADAWLTQEARAALPRRKP